MTDPPPHRDPGRAPADEAGLGAGLLALTRAVPPTIARCELTHRGRESIDLERARAQHRSYEEALASLGCAVERLQPEPGLPDSAFVEDVAVILPELAVVARPGAASRRAEAASVAAALRPHRPLAFIEPPGTLDGGDVLCLGRRLLVGRSERTDREGLRRLRALVAPFGYDLEPVPISGCLHLKTAVTLVAEGTVLLNPAWVDPEVFAGMKRIEVDAGEPFAANALALGAAVLFPAAYPRTRRRLERRGLEVLPLEVDELAKAEAGLTCCSLLVTRCAKAHPTSDLAIPVPDPPHTSSASSRRASPGELQSPRAAQSPVQIPGAWHWQPGGPEPTLPVQQSSVALSELALNGIAQTKSVWTAQRRVGSFPE